MSISTKMDKYDTLAGKMLSSNKSFKKVTIAKLNNMGVKCIKLKIVRNHVCHLQVKF